MALVKRTTGLTKGKIRRRPKFAQLFRPVARSWSWIFEQRSCCLDEEGYRMCFSTVAGIHSSQRQMEAFPAVDAISSNACSELINHCSAFNHFKSSGPPPPFPSSPFSSLPLPHLTSPHLTSPHLTSPHLTSPHLTSPHRIPSNALSTMTRFGPTTVCARSPFMMMKLGQFCSASLIIGLVEELSSIL